LKEEIEIMIAKIVAIVIISLTAVSMCEGSDKITELFSHYNRAQSAAFSAIVQEAAKEYGVEPEIIAAIIVVESGVRSHVISKDGDYGLMQIRYRVHRDKVKTINELLDPKTNIFIGTRIFKQYLNQKKTLRSALIRYSGGNRRMADKVLRIRREL